jgi:HlyD family secretion protein
MKKKLWIAGGIVGIAAIVTLMLKPFSANDKKYTFETLKVEKGKISNVVTATGTVEAVTSVDVGTQVSGIIEKIYADFNDQVKQGQLLALIDKKQLSAQLEQTRATLDQAQAQLNFQEATFNRLKILYEKQLIAQSDYDQALYNYENARASVRNAKSAYDRNLINLNYSSIYSPIDGVVLNRAIEEGQTVAASFNTPTLFTIVNDLTQMEVETSVDEADIGKVKQNQRVEFSVDAYSDLKFEGRVAEVRLQPTTTNNVVTYSVILSAPNPDKKLMPGMTASATIFVEEKDSTLMLSGKAIRFMPDMAYLQNQKKTAMKNYPQGPPVADGNAKTGNKMGTSIPPGMPAIPTEGAGNILADHSKMVWIKDSKGDIKPVKIIAGIDNGTFIEILSGLNEGDEVIVSMSDGLAETAAGKKQDMPRGPFPF